MQNKPTSRKKYRSVGYSSCVPYRCAIFYNSGLRYEYLAGAYHDLGRNKEFSEIMVDYEQICLAYGSRESKMNFYVWLSLTAF